MKTGLSVFLSERDARNFSLRMLRRRALAARGASPAAFDGRRIRAGGVAPPSNTFSILGCRALPARRLARLGAARHLHHGLLGRTPSSSPKVIERGSSATRHEWGYQVTPDPKRRRGHQGRNPIPAFGAFPKCRDLTSAGRGLATIPIGADPEKAGADRGSNDRSARRCSHPHTDSPRRPDTRSRPACISAAGRRRRESRRRRRRRDSCPCRASAAAALVVAVVVGPLRAFAARGRIAIELIRRAAIHRCSGRAPGADRSVGRGPSPTAAGRCSTIRRCRTSARCRPLADRRCRLFRRRRCRRSPAPTAPPPAPRLRDG